MATNVKRKKKKAEVMAEDGSMTLTDAHSIAERVHNAVEKKHPEIKHIMIHENPAEQAE